MAKNIFLLGTPGCGKSEVYRRITKRLEEENLGHKFTRIDDFPKLWNIFQTDTEYKRCRPTEDGGYKVTDNGIWDEILRLVNDDVLKIQNDYDFVFIEFARPNYVHSLTNFSDEILKDAIVIYIDCPFNECWRRNVARHEAAVAAGGDDHLVSREEMEVTYGTDDHNDLLSQDYKSVIVDNSTDDLSKIDGEVEKIIDALK